MDLLSSLSSFVSLAQFSLPPDGADKLNRKLDELGFAESMAALRDKLTESGDEDLQRVAGVLAVLFRESELRD
jgi:hypothetical protein